MEQKYLTVLKKHNYKIITFMTGELKCSFKVRKRFWSWLITTIKMVMVHGTKPVLHGIPTITAYFSIHTQRRYKYTKKNKRFTL